MAGLFLRQSSLPRCRPPPPERSTSVATQRPAERLTFASTRVSPARRPEKPEMRGKRGELVTRMRTVPRSWSRRRKVGPLRSTETTVPSNCRVAALEVAGATAATAARAQMVAISFFMTTPLRWLVGSSLARAPQSAPKPKAKLRLNLGRPPGDGAASRVVDPGVPASGRGGELTGDGDLVGAAEQVVGVHLRLD